MAIPWFVVLQSVPWTEVIKNAPRVAEGAKKLWSTIGGKKVEAAEEDAVEDATQSPELREVRALQLRVAALEETTAALHEQMLASSELIKELAEQNAQLVKRIETNRILLRWALVIFCVSAILTVYELLLAR